MFPYVFSGATLADALVPSVQGFHILLSVFIIIVIGDLAAQLSVVRLGLRAQKIALREMLAQVEKMATHDELTGLPNRRQVLDLLAHEERRSHRKNHPPCVAVIDIDHFKRVNDTKGHQAGDETLRQFARIMLETLRTGDVLARWGGEEFLLLLPDTPLDEAVQVMQRLRERCAAPGQWGEWHHLQVSFSAGIAALQPDETTQSAIARADAALYAAKHAGRNQVQVAH